MKKLFLVLALLVMGSIWTQGAFANQYPFCYKGYGSSDPLYNGTNGDRFKTKGWCIDDFGVLTPDNGITTSSTQPNSYGGFAVPNLDWNIPSSGTSDTLIAQQTGTTVVDFGGFGVAGGGQAANLTVANINTIDTLTGVSGHYTLPPTSTVSTSTTGPALQFTFTSATKTVMFVDTASTADTIMFSPSGTGGSPTAGSNIKSPGGAGDHVTLESPYPGMWVITSMGGVNPGTTADTLWTSNGTGK